MRVMQLTQRFPPAIGGVEEHVRHLADGLGEAGIDVKVLTTDLAQDVPFRRLPKNPPDPSHQVVRARAWKLLEMPHGLGVVAPSMLMEALTTEADILHAHAYGYFPTWVGSLATALDSCALVITPHCDAGRGGMARWLFDRVVPRLTVRRAAQVIALTHQEASYLTSVGVPAERISVIPNGIDLEEFNGPPALHETAAGTTLLFVGRLYPQQKGLTTLIEALALLPEALDLRLRLVGEDWGGTSLIRQLASRLHLEGRVTVLGPLSRAELLREYRRADVLVLPSRFEPFGIVLLEAMASGLPVVASRTGGIPEIVEDGRTGLLVPPGDPRRLADAIQRIAEDEPLRQAMGRAGRQRVASYSWKSLIPRILHVYEEALGERR